MATAKQVKMRRGTTLDNDLFTGAEGEITVDLSVGTARVHDGVKLGGNALALANLDNVPDNTDFEQRILDAVQALIAAAPGNGAGGGIGGEEPMAIGDVKTTFANPGTDYLPLTGGVYRKGDYPALYTGLGDLYGTTASSPTNSTLFPPTYTSAPVQIGVGTATNGTLIVSASTGTTTVLSGQVGGLYATSSDGGNTWTASRDNVAQLTTAITFGAGKFVAVGTNKIVTSTDGLTWTPATTAVTAAFTAIFFAGGRFFAYAPTTSYTSTDGLTWTSFTWTGFTSVQPTVVYWNPTAFLFYTGGASGALSGSANGTTWTAQTSNMTNTINAMAHNSTTMILVGGNGSTTANIAYSTNFTSWTAATTTTIAQSRTSAVWVPALSKFVTGGNSGVIATSPDGIAWTALSLSAGGTIGTMTFNSLMLSADGATVYALGATALASSTDAVTFTTLTNNKNSTSRLLAYPSTAAGALVTNPLTNIVMWGSTGVARSTDNGATSYHTLGLCSSSGSSMTVGFRGGATKGNLNVFVSSPNANPSFGEANLFTSCPFYISDSNTGVIKPVFPGVGYQTGSNPIAYLGNRFFTWGSFGGLSSSTDGVTWTPSFAMPHTALVNKVAYNANKWVAVCSNGFVATSANGTTWNPVASHPLVGSNVTDVKWVPSLNKFVACGGTAGVAMTSADGVTWTSLTLKPANFTATRILFTDSYLAFVQANNLICSSPFDDLVNWSFGQAPTSNIIDAGGPGFVGGSSVIQVYTNVSTSASYNLNNPIAFFSRDGISWTTIPIAIGLNTSAVLRHACWTGKGFIITGSNGNYPFFITSANGVDWTVKQPSFGSITNIPLAYYMGDSRVMLTNSVDNSTGGSNMIMQLPSEDYFGLPVSDVDDRGVPSYIKAK